MHIFVADVGLSSVLQGSQFDLREAYLAYYCSCEVDWGHEDSVESFPYDSANGNEIYVPAPEITTSRRTFSDAQVKKWVGVVFVVFKSLH